jgi:hypothetical protein
MARILHNDEWFEEISSRGHYETEYEKVLAQEAQKLFTHFHLIPFKTAVSSEIDADTRIPDFALVHKNYKSWWVVEVELGHHSLEGHVLPQVRTLARAKYGQTEADYLCGRLPALDRAKIMEMFKGSPPRVLVVVNVPVPGWAEQLRAFEAMVVICQIFRSQHNRYVLRLNGEYPSEDETVLTTCECSPMIHRLLALHAPTQLPLQPDERVLLYHEGQASEWERVDTAGEVYLHALRDHNLTPGRRYEIVRQSDETLLIRLSDSRKQK